MVRIHARQPCEAWRTQVPATRSNPRKGRPRDQSMRGSHAKHGELKSPPRAATLGKVALATNPCEAAMRSMANSSPRHAQQPSERSPSRPIHARQPCEAWRTQVPATRSHPRKGRPGDQSMRGSHAKHGELKSPPRAATLGKVAPATNPCEAAMRSMANSSPRHAQPPSERSPRRPIHARQPCEAWRTRVSDKRSHPRKDRHRRSIHAGQPNLKTPSACALTVRLLPSSSLVVTLPTWQASHERALLEDNLIIVRQNIIVAVCNQSKFRISKSCCWRQATDHIT